MRTRFLNCSSTAAISSCRQALLIAQAHRLTDKQRLSLRGRLRVHDMHLQTDIGGGQMRALVRAGQLLADGDHKDLIPPLRRHPHTPA